MHKCYKCGAEFEGSFCPECGTQWQESKNCPSCGAALAGETKFCNNCGYSFVGSTEKKPRKENKFFKWLKSHLKIVIPVAIALVAMIVVLSLIPTFIVMSVNGTYYYSASGELSKTRFIKLSTGKWTDDEGGKGKYKLSGSKITLTYDMDDELGDLLGDLGDLFGEEFDITMKGTVKNGVLTIDDDGREEVYVTKSHKHKFGEWETTLKPTCTEEGIQKHICDCKKAETEAVVATGHSFTSDHICSICGEETDHIFNTNNECTLCGIVNIDGLLFMWSNDAYRLKEVKSISSNIVIPSSCNGKPVVGILQDAFYGCTSLTSVTIPNSVTEIGYSAFYGCTSLTSITIPDSVTTIESNAFYGCSALESVTIGSGVTTIGERAFEDCISLTTVNWNAENCVKAGSSNFPIFRHCTNLSTINIDEKVRNIPDYAFNGCTSLTIIVIPNSVTSIGDEAFRECKALTSITIPDSVTTIGARAFSSCSALTSISLPNSVTTIGEAAFHSCSALTNITIPNKVTAIGYSTFYYCSSLKSITIPNSVTSIGYYAFYGCSSLTSIEIPNSVTSIGTSAFYECSKLTSITLPNSVTEIGSGAFNGCTSLTSVTIGSGVTSIGDSAFRNCGKLSNIQFEGSRTQWKAIEKGTYWDRNAGNYIVQCTDGKLDKDGNEIED